MLVFIKKRLIFLLLPLLLVACDNESLYYENMNIPNEKWRADAPLTFIINIADTTHIYALGFTIRYNENYTNQNIYLFLQTTLPNGKITKDTVTCDLFQPNGKPWGKGNRIKELNVIYGSLIFPMQGKYTMKVTHAMRTDTLKGINSIGLFISPKKEKKNENN